MSDDELTVNDLVAKRWDLDWPPVTLPRHHPRRHHAAKTLRADRRRADYAVEGWGASAGLLGGSTGQCKQARRDGQACD